jgi:hypothetical protein
MSHLPLKTLIGEKNAKVYGHIFKMPHLTLKKTLIELPVVVRALKFVHATSALIVALLTILVARATMRSINYLGRSIDNALDRPSCLSPCAPSKYLILQRCCHVSPNTRALALTTSSPISLQVPQKNTAFCLKVLQNTETPKLTKKSKNNKAKGLRNAN